MSWLDQVGSLLQQYTGDTTEAAASPQDFRQVAQSAPPDALAQGVADAFRSDQTPPFAQMLSQVFSQSNDHQRAGILNTLIAAIGPALLSQVLSRAGAGGLGALLGGGQSQVTPQQASGVSPDLVGEIATHAAQIDPAIIDQVSGFLSGHPQLLESLGSSALGNILSGLAQRHL